jgi:hypothetical protein
MLIVREKRRLDGAILRVLSLCRNPRENSPLHDKKAVVYYRVYPVFTANLSRSVTFPRAAFAH